MQTQEASCATNLGSLVKLCEVTHRIFEETKFAIYDRTNSRFYNTIFFNIFKNRFSIGRKKYTKMRVFNLQFNIRMSCPCTFASVLYSFRWNEFWKYNRAFRFGTTHPFEVPCESELASRVHRFEAFSTLVTFQVATKRVERAVCFKLLSRYFLISSFSPLSLDPPFYPFN